MTRLLLAWLVPVQAPLVFSAEAPALPESPENDAKILALTDKVLREPLAKETAGHLAVITGYAEAAERIHVTIVPALLPIDDPNATLYTGMYVAAATRFDLMHPAQSADEEADRSEIVKFLKATHAALRKQDKTYRNAMIEKLR